MNRSMWSAILLAGASIHAAAAEPPLSVSPGSREIVITARNVSAMPQHATARGTRIEVELAPSAAPATLTSTDSTVRSVSILAGDRPLLSVAVHHSSRTTARIAAEARVERFDGGIRMVFPREPGWSEAEVTRTPTPEPPRMAPPAPERVVTSPAPATERAAPTTQRTAVATSTLAPPAKAASSLPVLADPPAPMAALTTSAAERPRGPQIALAILALAAAGVLLLLRKRKSAAPAEPPIKVIASQALGGKSRVVLIAAGGRQMLLAIGDQGPRLIGRWEAPVSTLRPAGFDVVDEDFFDRAVTSTQETASPEHAPPEADEFRPRPIAASPAVAGLLRLRQMTPARSPEVDEDTHEGPSEWTREAFADLHKGALS